MQLYPCHCYIPLLLLSTTVIRPMSRANNGQEKYAKYKPNIYVSMRDISGQKTNVTMAHNSKIFYC